MTTIYDDFFDATDADEIREKVRAEMKTVRQMCSLAGRPELADKLIADGTTPKDVATTLAKAKRDHPKSFSELDVAGIYAKFNNTAKSVATDG